MAAKYVALEVVAAAGVTSAYLCTAGARGEPLDVFLDGETRAYGFATSQFDVWMFSLLKGVLLTLCATRCPPRLLVTVFLVGAIVFLAVKAMLFDFAVAPQYLCQVLAIVTVVAEMLLHLHKPGAHARHPPLAPKYSDYSYAAINDVENGGALPGMGVRESRNASTAMVQQRPRAATVESDSEYVSAEEDDSDTEATAGSATSAHEQRVPGHARAHHEAVKPINRLRPLSEFAFRETDEEIDKVAQLRRCFARVPDERLLRFLRARDGDVAAAATMADDNLRFRHERRLDQLDFSSCSPVPLRGFVFGDTNGTDNPGQWDIETLNYYSGSCIHKWTRDGSPLVLFPLGSSDARGVGQNITREVLETAIISSCEMIGNVILPEIEHRVGKIRPSITIVFDVEGLGLRQFYMPTLRLFQGLLQKVESNYPESLQVVMIINAPAIFQMFWTVVKPFLPARTLSKIRIYGSDYHERLHELVPPEHLPWFLGGLCSCRFEGGCLPYPLSKGYTDPHRDAEGYIVSKRFARGASYDHPIAVSAIELELYHRHHGSLPMPLAWTFKLAQGDAVHFALLYTPDFDLNYARAPERLKTLRETDGVRVGQVVSDEIVVSQPGTYVLRWTATGPGAGGPQADVRFRLKSLPPPARLGSGPRNA